MKLNIKSKLLTGFVLLLILYISISFLVLNKLSESNERLNDIVDNSGKKVILSEEILIAVLDAARQEKNIILEKDPIQNSYYREKIYQALKTVDDKTLDLKGLVDKNGSVFLDDFIDTWQNYQADLKEIISLSMQNETDKAFKISTEKGLKTRDKSINQLEKIIEINMKNMVESKNENNLNYDSTVNLIVILLIFSILSTVIISYWIIQSITKRIVFITSEAEKIASREYTNENLVDNAIDELNPVINSLININESFKEVSKNANSVASGDFFTEFNPRSEKDLLGNALKKMTISLRESTEINEKHNWITSGQNQLGDQLMGDLSIEEISTNTINFLCSYLQASIGAFYVLNDKDNSLILRGHFAFQLQDKNTEVFSINEGLIGQAAREQKQLSFSDINNEHLRITSLVLNAIPKNLLITPFLFQGKSLGVIEIGKLKDFTKAEIEFINLTLERIAISINSAITRKKIQELLEETQVQSEELQSQQEELKQMNEELEEQTQNLKSQQEELQMTNEELEEQTQSLEMKNKEVEEAKHDIEQKTRQLEISSKYKSEFLANMSHELRTPLNSLLILSKDLSDNKSKNLKPDQVESAEIIYKSGQDLLILINEVLDLSKIEAGKMPIYVERVSLRKLIDTLVKEFNHHADQKGIRLTINFGENLPEAIRTDPQRLNQILKNLLSNAIKFTYKGTVSISIESYSENAVIISISDTGIGIPENKQLAIFEAFQQAEGGTSRKYGGTGLGLSISRELAKLLDAEIKLKSNIGKGSVFSLILPLEIASENTENETSNQVTRNHSPNNNSDFINYPAIQDNRENIHEDDVVILIIEDDLKFASILLKQANRKGFKCISAVTGEDGLKLAAKFKPHAIILDLDLPGMKGESVLAELKSDPALRHIPVHIASIKERSMETIKGGAIEYLTKPVSKEQLDEAFNRMTNFINRKMKNLLIIEDDKNSRIAIRKLIGNGDVKCFEAGTGSEALKQYSENQIDCIVLDLGLPDMNGFELIYKFENIKDGQIPPIIIYTGKELTKEENDELQKYSESIIIKGVKSEERLLDETAMFLHRAISKLPEAKQIVIQNLYDKEAVLNKKTILIVDDDMRNVFALSKILKQKRMNIHKADNGKSALEMLEKNKNIDLVLMDIMMPEMDGYEAMKLIREQKKFKDLPIIALTAKAMKDDKQKCIDAGANDYIVKPIEVERLLSLMRVWLGK